MATIYIPATRADTRALNVAAERGAVRRIARGVYTDDVATPPERLIREHLPAILAGLYPDWYLSYSTAATLGPVGGVAFISGSGRYASVRFLPGLIVKRVRPLSHPEVVTLDVLTMVAPRLSVEASPARVRASSPLQMVFEVLSRDARQPERQLPDEDVRALIDALSEADLRRAPAFAKRNGLAAEWARFQALHEGLRRAQATPLRGTEGLDLYFYRWRVGRLEALSRGEFRFTYDARWPIALSGLPRDQSPAYEGALLPPFFENLLPEGWAEARLRATFKIARDDTFGLLRTTQKYLSNLTLRPDGFDASGTVLDYLDRSLARLAPDPTRLLSVRETIGGDPDTRELWLDLRRRGATRLSGVQPKLPVHLAAARGRVTVSIGDLATTSTHILKLRSPEFPQLIENEWAVMELARRCGLPLPAVRRVAFPADSPLPSPALLVERFDLPTSLEAPGDLLLLEDAASLLGLRREDKYRPSHERIVETLEGVGLGPEDLARHFDHVAFSWIVGNGDLHAKNVSVVHRIAPGRLGGPPSKRGTGYTPLYDLVCTRLAIRDDQFALTLNGRRDNLRLRDFAALTRRWGWTLTAVRDRLEGLAERIEGALGEVVEVSGLAEDRQKHLVRLVTTNLKRLTGRDRR